MGFGKSLGYSLILFVALNFVFALLASAIGGTINTFFDGFTSDPLSILIVLFMPILMFPGLSHLLLLGSFLGGGELQIALLLTLIGYIASPLIAALVGGNMAETKAQAFGAWLVTMFISAGALIAAYFIGQELSTAFGALGDLGMLISLITGTSEMGDILMIGFLVLNAYLNGAFYGCFAQLTSGMDYY
ncbi:MAG: hypothetical protein R6U96_15530 [Promethearchaeia archaeon]